MAKVERFEDLKCWKAAREVVRDIYFLTRQKPIASDFGLLDQLQRAAVSIMSNIAEGFARFNQKDFIRFLNYSQSSAAELKSLLYVLYDTGLINKTETEQHQKKIDDTRFLVLGLINYLNSNTISEPQSNYYTIDQSDDKL